MTSMNGETVHDHDELQYLKLVEQTIKNGKVDLCFWMNTIT